MLKEMTSQSGFPVRPTYFQWTSALNTGLQHLAFGPHSPDASRLLALLGPRMGLQASS